MQLGVLVFLIYLFSTVLVLGSPNAYLTVQAYDTENTRIDATVEINGNEIGVAWSSILLDAGVYHVVVSSSARRWAGQLLLLNDERKTFSVTLVAAPPMILVQSGSFLMGSPVDEPGRHDDECQHLVTLTRGFWIGATEVSQSLYEEIIGANPSRWVSSLGPVENVTWFDCIRFCNQLSDKHGFQPVYTIIEDNVVWDQAADGYRLPTEAEWEYACRAGSRSVFSFGDDPAQLYRFGNYCDRSCERAWRDTTQLDGYFHTAPIGSFEPNAWGIYDMHGNIWEWCWDWWAPFEASTLVDPHGPLAGTHKAERGGCWEVGPEMCRQAYRHYVEPDQKRSYLGFRIARTQQ